jgi:glycosyltransferase involved in cell wall biosynthesis
MRVIFITPNFPNPLDPTRGNPNYQSARALARRHHITVIAHVSWLDELRRRRRSQALERVRTVDGIEVHHPRYYYPPGLMRSRYGWFLWHSIRPTILNVLDRFQPDVVLAGWIHPEGDSALRVSGLASVPCVVWSGGSDALVLPRDPARRACIADVLARCDAIVCVSDHLKRAIIDLGAQDSSVHIVRNGLDQSRFFPGDREAARRRLKLPAHGKMILWVGNFVPVKGVEVLIDACATLRDRGVAYRLCLIGGGPMRSTLAARVARAGLQELVSFMGKVPNEKLADWYRAADLTVLSSYSEGVPNVLYESMCCGTPFVASAVGGVPEIADAGLDRLVPSGDPAILADSIQIQLTTPPGPPRGSLPGTWEEHGLKLEAVLQQAIADRRWARPALAGSKLEAGRC